MKSTVMDFDYPWGTVSVPQGHEAYEFYASCDADDHLAHPHCHPGWEDRVAAVEGRVLIGPVLDTGWYVLVAVPEGTSVPSSWGVPVTGTPVPTVRVDLLYPRAGWTTVRLYASSVEAEAWAVRVLQPAGPARAYRVRPMDRRTRRMMEEGLFKPLEVGKGVWVYYLDA